MVLNHHRARTWSDKHVCTCNGEPRCTCRCVRACVRVCVQQETGQYTQVSSVCCPPIIPVVCAMGTSPTIVGWLALRLSACEFGSAGAGLHFVMRSERMADAMREMGFEGELLVSTGSPPESH